ncbi:MAG TPA: protein translocase subunit SecF [Gemmatimonadaceae bacterium]|nr:protein translocase subunit SecF [Gemmatimonadaceae bacterium]
MLRILHDTKYDFIKWWKQGLFIRLAFIAIGLVILGVNKLHWSIEFTGGTLMQVQFAQPTSDDAVRRAVAGAGFTGAEIQQFGTPRDYTIRAQATSERATGDSTRAQIERSLHAQFGDTSQVKVLRSEYVGPTVGAELRRNAIMAMLAAFVVTLIYLAMRFEWRFGVAAIVANAHEIFATFAFLAMMRLEFSLTVLAAILTVIGYSLNDTIIIFDRVRENLKKQRKESLRDVVNRSINETLPRSVLTHATVLAAALALLFFAGPVLRPFSWIMAFGVFTATFTSIYISGALLLWIETKWPRTTGESKGTARALAEGRRREHAGTVASR